MSHALAKARARTSAGASSLAADIVLDFSIHMQAQAYSPAAT